jgi:uncharacterized protein YraI
MKSLLKPIIFQILFLLVFTSAAACNGEEIDLPATVDEVAQQETVAAAIDATMTTVAKLDEMAGISVAATITAISINNGIDEESTPVTEVDATSIAATVIAGFALTPMISTPDSFQPRMRVRENFSGSAINIRNGPSSCFRVINTLSKGKIVIVLGSNSDQFWYQIELENGTIGWVWSANVEFVDPNVAGQVPVIRPIPACPTSTPFPTATPRPPDSPPAPPPTVGPPQPTATMEPTSYPLPPTIQPTPTSGGPYPYP